MILFFDRSLGRSIPRALRSLVPPIGIEYHAMHFRPDEPDDVWLHIVGEWGWTVIGQDYRFHERPSELTAINQHRIGVFYLWGAEATKWEAMRVFARAYDRIVEASDATPRPFVYRIGRDGRLRRVVLQS